MASATAAWHAHPVVVALGVPAVAPQVQQAALLCAALTAARTGVSCMPGGACRVSSRAQPALRQHLLKLKRAADMSQLAC